jgi:tetratricopeptide (TPR) repeat protein
MKHQSASAAPGGAARAAHPSPGFSVEEAFARALAQHRAGHLAQAAQIYRQIHAVAPQHFDCLHLLGVVARQLGHDQAAVELISQAIALNGEIADFHCNLGTALQRQARFEEAVPAYRRAIALKPDLVVAHNNLGVALHALTRRDEAETALTQALALAPDYGDAHKNLGNCLLDEGRIEAARGHFEAAIRCHEAAGAGAPLRAEAHGSLGNLLLTTGELDAACRELDRAVTLDPRQARYFRSLVGARRIAPDDPLLAEMERLADDATSLPPDQQIELHFGLGKALEDVGEAERSFRHLLAGNALKRRQLSYDPAMADALYDRIGEVMSQSLLQQRRGAGDPSALPIFIVGMPRSGTTLVEQMLASHSRVFGAGERLFLAEEITALRLPDGSPAPFPAAVPLLSDEALRRLGASYLERLHELSPDAQRMTDKMPANFAFVGLIHLILPNARIIHMRRDPVDTCLSCFSQLFARGQYFSYDLGELGQYWRAYDRLMTHWRSVLPEGAMLEVQYETLVANFEAESRRILAYCGLDWEPACLAFHATKRTVQTASLVQVRRNVYQSSVGRRRPPDILLQPLLDALELEP